MQPEGRAVHAYNVFAPFAPLQLGAGATSVHCRCWQAACPPRAASSLCTADCLAQRFDVRFLAGPESEEELPLRHRVGQAGQLQSFIPGHEMTCQLKRVAFFLNQLDVDADFISAMDGDQQPVTAVGQAEIQVLRGWRAEKRFAMYSITIADRADVDLQVSAKRLPEQIMGDEKILPCGLHLEPRRTDLFLGREAARRFLHEMGVFTEAKRMYENF